MPAIGMQNPYQTNQNPYFGSYTGSAYGWNQNSPYGRPTYDNPQNPYAGAGAQGAVAGGPWGAVAGMALQVFGAIQTSRERRKQWKEYERQMDRYYKERGAAQRALQYPNIYSILKNFYGPGIAREPGKNYSGDAVRNTARDPHGSRAVQDETGRSYVPDYLPPPPMAADPSVMNAPGGLQARAQGGPVEPGQPYLVGEQGPEVVVPQSRGTVLPNPMTPTLEMSVANPDTSGGSSGGGTGTGGVTNTGSGVVGGVPNSNTTTGGTTTNPTPGEMITYWMSQLLQSPGKTGTFGYEQAQEHANRGLTTASHAISGNLSGRGIDPGSGMGQIMEQSAVNNNAQLKASAARDFAALQESLFRQDIAAGEQMYQNALANAMGLAGAQSNSFLGGNVYPNIGGIPSYNSGLGTAAGLAGYWLGQQYGGQSSNSNITVNTGGNNNGFGG